MILALLAFTTLACSACKDESEDPEPQNNNTSSSIPDLIVEISATENGNVIETISFNFPKQNGSTAACNGSYNDGAKLFALNCLGKVGSAGPAFSYAGATGGVKTGTYDLKSAMAAVFTLGDATPFLAKSGALKIEKVDLYASVGNLNEYFIEADLNGTFENSDGTRTITVSGKFKGVNIKSN